MDAKKSKATVKAMRHWGEAWLHVRGELRAGGVHGDLRRIDDRASGTRGRAVPVQHYNDALEMAQHEKMPRAVWKQRVWAAVEHIIDLAYDAHEQSAAQPLRAS